MKHKLNFILGAIMNYLFNNWITHIPLHWLRITFLRVFNKDIARSAKILLHVRILNFWNLKLGERSIINSYSLLDCRHFSIQIEHDVDIGPYTRIWTLGHDPHSDSHKVKGGSVSIKHHSWIASGVTILPNVNLEKGSVVASASVVTKTVPSLKIVAGNPAKIIGDRNNPLTYEINYKVFLE